MAPRVSAVLFVLLFVALPVASAATPAASTHGGPAAQSTESQNLVSENTTFHVQLQPDGDARWTITESFVLADANDTRAFEQLGEAFVAGLLADVDWLRVAGQILFPAVIGTVSWSEERTYTVSTAGLEQRNPVARRLFRWDTFEGYTRTDDALVLHRPWRVDTRFALADLDDPDAVDAAIGQYLPAA